MAYIPPPEFGTAEFLARLQRQDRDAIQQVVHEFLPQILRAARGAGLDEHEADDVTQQVFLTFIETLPRFEGRSQVRTWLFGILYHKLREARRGFQKQDKHDDIDDMLESRFDDRGMWQNPPRKADDDLWDQQIRKRMVVSGFFNKGQIRHHLVFPGIIPAEIVHLFIEFVKLEFQTN